MAVMVPIVTLQVVSAKYITADHRAMSIVLADGSLKVLEVDNDREVFNAVKTYFPLVERFEPSGALPAEPKILLHDITSPPAIEIPASAPEEAPLSLPGEVATPETPAVPAVPDIAEPVPQDAPSAVEEPTPVIEEPVATSPPSPIPTVEEAVVSPEPSQPPVAPEVPQQ